MCWFKSRKFCNKLCHAANGNIVSTEQVLKDILLQQGVPVDAVQHRVQHAIKVMGLRALQSDIDSVSANRSKVPLPRRRQEPDPWGQGNDPWATPKDNSKPTAPVHDEATTTEMYDVAQSLEDTDGNEIYCLPTADLKPGASGYALVALEEVASIVTIFKAANQLEPCLALCPAPVPGVPAQCETNPQLQHAEAETSSSLHASARV